MKIEEKKLARILRKKGKSINQIVRETNFSKASVSLWVRDIVITDVQKRKISEGGRSVESIERRRSNRLKNELAKRQLIIEKAKEHIASISLKDLKIIGSMLYWAEGRKRGGRTVTFTNSDPEVIRTMMRFFREICMVQELKFRAHIHTYSHLNALSAVEFWSTLTSIPKEQFYKTYIKPSVSSKGKMDRLPFGTIDIIICDTRLFLTILGWIEKIGYLVNCKANVKISPTP